MSDLTEGINSPELFSEQETLEIAKVLEEASGSPLSFTWERMLKKKVKGYYWQLAHLNKANRDIATVSFISGCIQCLEILLNAPKEFSGAAKSIEENEKRQP